MTKKWQKTKDHVTFSSLRHHRHVRSFLDSSSYLNMTKSETRDLAVGPVTGASSSSGRGCAGVLYVYE
jgi:hypothetical protein